VLPEAPASRGGASAYPKFGEASEAGQSKRAKAAEEARRKAEAEADARAEAKAQAEARKQAEADARAEAKAQAEARKQAEADARAGAKARAEARKQARTEALAEDEEEGKGKSKTWIVAIAAVLLVAAGGYYALSLRKPAPKPVVADQTVAQTADSTSLTSTAKPKPTPTTAAATAATTAKPTAAEAAQDQQTTPAPVQSAAMQQQLNATSKLSGNLKAGPDNSVAPSSGINMDMGNAGGTPNVFGSKAGPKVTAAAAPSTRMISVAASIMAGRAVSRTPPSYPAFARTARVDGTVVLHASISKAGTIENVSVISGPSMLRQAAIDAVKTWRYKPYLLDNEPVEVETTVNVVFVLQ
jgi:protein TonB